MTTTRQQHQRLAVAIACEGIHGITGRAYEEGTLEPGALIRDVHTWGEGDYCDPERGPLPDYAEPETTTFLASTDGGKTWYRQRSNGAPLCE